MKSLLHLFLFAVTISHISSKPHHTEGNLFREKVVSGPVPAEYKDALRRFAQKSVSTPSFFVTTKPDRAIAADPLSLGYLYAVLNEQSVFQVENGDILKALHLSQEEIPKVFTALINQFNQDKDVAATNAVFSRAADLNETDVLKDLRSYRETLQLADNLQAVPKINDYVADHTKNLIRDQLLPLGEDAFYNSTQAVVVNTVYLKKNLRTPFTPVGQRKFQFGKSEEESKLVETLELNNAKLRTFSGEEYSAVLIPLGNAETRNTEKSLILIRPRECIDSFLKNNVEDIFTKDFMSKLVTKENGVRVQVPVLNFTLARQFSSEFERTKKIPSFTSAICDSSTKRLNFLQKIVQVSAIRLSSETLELGEALGVSVENVKQYRKEFGGDGPSSASSGSDASLSGGVKTKPGTKYNKNDYISITEASSSSIDVRSGLAGSEVVAVAEPEPEPLAEAEPEPSSDSIVKSSRPKAIFDVDDRPVLSLTKENQNQASMLNKNERIIPVRVQSESSAEKDGHMGILKTGSGDKKTNNDNDFIFDAPFFAYVYDEDLGPIQFLAVKEVGSKSDQDQVQVQSPNEDFSDYARLSRYVCLAPPAPAPGLIPPSASVKTTGQAKKSQQQYHYTH